MGTGTFSEGRSYPRRPLKGGQIQGRLVHHDMVNDIPALAVDVSPSGLGVLLDAPLAPGENVWLIVDGRVIRLTVRHCAKRRAAEDHYHCGLVSGGSWENIERIFARLGCIDER